VARFSIVFVLALVAGTGFATAQDIPPRPPDPLARPAAPATAQARDGVRNGTTKVERDQHIEPGAPNQTPPAQTLPPMGPPNPANR
jgi:hypothetical protein